MPHTKPTLYPPKPSSSVGWRSIAIGLILIPINCYWITYIELVQYSAQPTIVSLIFTVVFNVLVLIGLNQIFKRFLPRFALSQGELLVIYVMLSVASATAGHSMMEILVPTLGHAFWFATPENDWKDLFWRYIPRWLAVVDKDVLSGYYEGDSTLHTKQHLLGWLTPVINWFAFLFALLFVMLCINLIVRKPWTEDEKLAYPIIQLPARMTSEGFFTNRLMWLAFGLVAIFDIINGLHHIFPAIPSVYEKAYRFRFTEKPFSAMGWLRLGIYPFVLGIGFLIPLDLLFSSWFFFWVWKGQQLIGSVAGLEGTGYPYINYQGFGAYMGIFLIAVWRGRKYLQYGRGNPAPTSLKVHSTSTRDEPMSPRILVLALIAGVAFLTLFCLKAGMSLWAILVFFGLYFAFSTAVSRMRAELGSPMHDLHYTGPERVMVAAVGTRRLGPNNLSMFSFFWFFTRTFDSHPMPHQLEGFKLASTSGIRSRFMLFAILIALVVGILSQFWALISIPYRLGAVHEMSRVPIVYGSEPWRNLQNWLTHPLSPDYWALGFTGIGLLFSLFLMLMRMKFFWFPFHPAAYATVCGSWAVNYIWFSLGIVWVLKLVLLKYGGRNAHRKAMPFFLGLILGQFTVGSLWTILGMVFNIPTYGIWP
ncbi:MAG: hypothetical protein OXH39_20630 [Candidatus Poribacteria bacterium]|nr:hypothetical protein [Candidatus Poribacteria bacterium]